ncbi:MAG: hypothetical protein HYT93_00100 [Parcubacteria group bacterium]|nr:hypothetical protein [Parcubacteria group bacterium]
MFKNRINFWGLLLFLLSGFLIGFLAVSFVLQHQVNKNIKTGIITYIGRQYGILQSVDLKKNTIKFEERSRFSPEKRVINEIYFDKNTIVQRALIFSKDDIVYSIKDTIESSIENIRPGEYVIVYSSLNDNSKYTPFILHGEYLF